MPGSEHSPVRDGCPRGFEEQRVASEHADSLDPGEGHVGQTGPADSERHRVVEDVSRRAEVLHPVPVQHTQLEGHARFSEKEGRKCFI